MSMRRWIAAAGAVAVAVMGSARGQENSTNVVFIVVDDLKPALGSYGDPVADTPAMDALISRGLRMDNTHSQKPECAPSRASMLTGMRNDELRVWGFNEDFRKLNPKLDSLPGWLRRNNYRTESVGKIWDNRYFDSDKKGDVCGSDDDIYCSFDNVIIQNDFFDEGNTLCDGHHARRWPSGKFSSSEKFAALLSEFNNSFDEYHVDYCTRVVAMDRLRYLAEEDTPFFLGIGFAKPHMPWVAPKRDFDKFRVVPDHALEPPPGFHTGSDDIDAIQDFWSETNPGTEPKDNGELESYDGYAEWSVADRNRAYYAATRFVDTQIGEIVKVINEELSAEVRDNTMIVLWGDHGYHLGEFNLWGKKTILEHATRVPCAVIPSAGFIKQNPDVQENLATGSFSTATPIDSVDLFPTIVDMVGLDMPETETAGTSLVPILRNASASIRLASVSQYETYGDSSMTYSVRTNFYRLIVRLSQTNSGEINDKTKPSDITGELYYYPSPGQYETVNLFDNPDYAEVREGMISLIKTSKSDNPDSNWMHLVSPEPPASWDREI
mmetsp:Transcript_17973/g.33196  ORF Transcript_17973/g.33196 Transcript_17973/m.33196 type:complete len:552 (-) Transcript_17973:121-1776(-)